MNPINHKTGCTPNGVHLYYGWFEAMHTRMDVLLVGRSEAEASGLVEEAYTEIKRLEERLNRFDTRSDLSKINNREYEGWGVATPSTTGSTTPSTPGYYLYDRELVKIFSDAQRYRELTEGVFNIAIQTPNFSAETDYYSVENQEEILIFPNSQAIFDFGAYAKGYALERMSQHLRVVGVTSALISFGNSSVVAIGRHPMGKMWEVCVDHPTSKGRKLATVELEDCAMSTSGNIPDNRGHIKSSITTVGITDSRLVTVKSTSALDCEVLSTALFAATDREQQERIIAKFKGAKFLEMKY